MQKIVFHKLLGFGTLTSDGVDFSDATFGAKLGAKVGDTEANGVAKQASILLTKPLAPS